MSRKSMPWAVVLSTPGGPIRSEHRSKPETYRKVAIERVSAQEGHSQVSRIRVEQWEPNADSWALYELIDPKEQ
jgi:hypothetical protein